ncbi:MAG: AAA family ATPase, partial [Victivallales bacterium]|nr:AAA family ATPase [Victivallales bacterium]
YGVSDFANMRGRNGYYVDNTWGIPLLEALPYQMFLRPRRFGKSLLLSILNYYYDLNSTDRFDELFGGTWIHEHPTPSRGQYMILHFDFSKVSGETVEDMQRSFEEKCKIAIDGFREAYKDYIPENLQEEMAKQATFSAELDILTTRLPLTSDKKIYIMVDEYDNFSNRILAQSGSEAYRTLTHGTGFFKSFFALLKAQNKVITNILLTGVSPMTLDDVTSGFNIAENISQDSQLSTLCGFTHKDIRQAFDYYAEAGRFPMDREQAFQLVTDWYDHYRFSEDNGEQVCNPVLLLGFLRRSMADKHFPRDMVDENLRTDYHKLRHVVTTNGRLNGKFDALEQLVTDGSMTTRLIRSFQENTLHKPESFISLLFYYGMVTIGEADFDGVTLTIPNQLMRQFTADFLLNGYRDVCGVDPRVDELAVKLGGMARNGVWRPAIELAAKVLKETLCARDLLDGEKAVQASLAALLSSGNAFDVCTEHRAGFGFADLAMAPRLISFPSIKYAALIEVKYIKKAEKLQENAKAALLSEARGQLERYTQEHRLAEAWHLPPKGTVTLIRLALVFHGEELVIAEEI